MDIRSVLVTGAGGFIGSHLVEDQLRRGRMVTALDVQLDRLEHLRNADGLKLVQGDIRDSEGVSRSLEQIDVVFHLASAHLEVSRSQSYFETINVDAARDLVERAAEAGVKRMVHCSTVGVYGALTELPANEETECRPDIEYEITKLKGEIAVREAAAKNELSTVILRPAWVYGPGCPRTLKLFRAIKSKRFVMVGDGNNFRHPIYIADMVDAFEKAALTDGINGETYIVASKEAVRLEELVAGIVSTLQMDYKPTRVPLIIMSPICAITEGLCRLIKKEPPFSTRSLKFFTESSSFDTRKVVSELEFDAAVSLTDGLRRTYESYLSTGGLE